MRLSTLIACRSDTAGSCTIVPLYPKAAELSTGKYGIMTSKPHSVASIAAKIRAAFDPGCPVGPLFVCGSDVRSCDRPGAFYRQADEPAGIPVSACARSDYRQRRICRGGSGDDVNRDSGGLGGLRSLDARPDTLKHFPALPDSFPGGLAPQFWQCPHVEFQAESQAQRRVAQTTAGDRGRGHLGARWQRRHYLRQRENGRDARNLGGGTGGPERGGILFPGRSFCRAHSRGECAARA